MPSNTERKKGRSKEDTWGAPELTNKLKDAHADREKRTRDRVKHRDGEDRERRSSEKKDAEKRSSEKSSKDKRESSRDRNKRDNKIREERHRTREGHERPRDSSRDRERRKEQDVKKSSQRDKESTDGERRERRRERKDDDHHSDRKRSEKERELRRGYDKDGSRRHEKEPRRGSKERGVRETEEERRRRKKEERREKERRLEEDARRKQHSDNRDDEKRKHRDKDSERRHREKEERQSKRKEEKDSSDRDRRRKGEEYEEERRRRKEEKKKLKHEKEEIDTREKEARKESQDEVLVPDGDPEADGYDDYDDDFEDYDDDFEDFEDDENGEETTKTETDLDDSTVAELRQAMEAENRLSSGGGPRDTSQSGSSKESSRPGTKKAFVNFVAAKQRQISNAVSERTRQRGEVLMRLIELDTVTFDLFDMPPVKDYERFIQHFGRSDTMQAAVQCNDDNVDRDIQTEDITFHDKWCQHPAEGTHCAGGDGPDEELELPVNQEAHSLRLTQFIESAGQLMAVLLEENRADVDGGGLYRNQTNLVFSEGYTQLKTEIPFIKGRAIIHAEVHPVQTHLILAAYGENQLREDSTLSGRGVLCVWNINDPSQPQKILRCRSQPSCCLWSPSKATMAFAGTADGSVVVWDLREPSSMHSHNTVESGTWWVRAPTFSTDGVMTEESHKSRVVSLLPIVTVQDNLRASMPEQQSEGSDVTFQLASLEEKGIINFWVVLEISKTSQAGSESELGVIPGGRVKLVWSSSISLNIPKRDPSLSTDFKALCFKLDPQVPSQFYIGTDGGIVLHASRHGNVYPKIYRDKFVVPVEVTHLDFSPFGLSCFLVGCSDGSIRLHSTLSVVYSALIPFKTDWTAHNGISYYPSLSTIHKVKIKLQTEFPLLSWPDSTMGSGISCMAWSQSRPSVFYSADTTSRVFVWSLLERDGNPIKEEKLSNKRLTALIASHDYSASSMGRPGRHPELVIADDSGSIEVHRLGDHFSNAPGDELDSMAGFLQSFS